MPWPVWPAWVVLRKARLILTCSMSHLPRQRRVGKCGRMRVFDHPAQNSGADQDGRGDFSPCFGVREARSRFRIGHNFRGIKRRQAAALQKVRGFIEERTPLLVQPRILDTHKKRRGTRNTLSLFISRPDFNGDLHRSLGRAPVGAAERGDIIVIPARGELHVGFAGL